MNRDSRLTSCAVLSTPPVGGRRRARGTGGAGDPVGQVRAPARDELDVTVRDRIQAVDGPASQRPTWSASMPGSAESATGQPRRLWCGGRLWLGGRRGSADHGPAAEEIPERRGHLGAYRRPGDHHVDHGHRRVGVPAGPGEADRHRGGLEGARVGDALVAQRVEVRGDDAGGGQAGQVAAQRGGAGVAAVGRIGVVIPEPPHQRRGEDVPVAVFLVGRPGQVRVHGRADQQLAAMSGPPASRASWQATAATLAPALQPATAS